MKRLMNNQNYTKISGNNSRFDLKRKVNKHDYVESEGEDEQEMNNWIENVQKYNGLPQEAIDSLCSMEFEGDIQEM